MSMDCIGPLDPPSAQGHRYCLCTVDSCTKVANCVLWKLCRLRLLVTQSWLAVPNMMASDLSAFRRRWFVRYQSWTAAEHDCSVQRLRADSFAVMDRYICVSYRLRTAGSARQNSRSHCQPATHRQRIGADLGRCLAVHRSGSGTTPRNASRSLHTAGGRTGTSAPNRVRQRTARNRFGGSGAEQYDWSYQTRLKCPGR